MKKVLLCTCNYKTPSKLVDNLINSFQCINKFNYDILIANTSICNDYKTRIFDNIIIDYFINDDLACDSNHSMAIQQIIEKYCHIYDDMILFDSDSFLLKDPHEIIDHNVVTSCEITKRSVIHKFPNKNNKISISRCLPMIQYFNLRLIKDLGVIFYPDGFMNKIFNIDFGSGCTGNNLRFASLQKNTGMYFYLNIIFQNLKIKEINMKDYILHLGGASYINSDKIDQFIKTCQDNINKSK